jgi:deoxyribose-phosphate aldolase
MSSRPHPAAQSIIVIIVIGGISLKEVTEVQNEIRKHYEKNPGTAPVKIILGSTCITSPDVMFKQLFCK